MRSEPSVLGGESFNVGAVGGTGRIGGTTLIRFGVNYLAEI